MTEKTPTVGAQLPQWVARLYAAMDAGDVDDFVAQLTDDIRLISGNADPVVGRDAAHAASTQLYAAIGGMSHTFTEVWEFGDAAILIADALYTRLDGSTVTLPCITHVHRRDGLVDRIHVYMDISPVFAGAAALEFMDAGGPTVVESAQVAVIKRFYDIADGRVDGDLRQLFTDDVVVYAPKAGVVHGLDAMEGTGRGRERFPYMAHHVGEFNILEQGERVFVEGTTEGETPAGDKWDGRVDTPGRFCAAFDFRDNRIRRMFVYFDPDFAVHGAAGELGPGEAVGT